MSEKKSGSKMQYSWWSISLERIKWYFSCFSWSWSSSKGSMWKISGLIGCYQVCLSCNQVVWFFDYQYLGREWSYILFFMHAVSHQGKVAFETTTFGCVWSDKLLVKLDCRILWPTISLKRIIWFLSFFMEFFLCTRSNWIAGFFGHQYPWKESIYTFVFLFLFISLHHLSNFAGVHLVMTY